MEKQYIRSELDIDYLPNIILVSTNNAKNYLKNKRIIEKEIKTSRS